MYFPEHICDTLSKTIKQESIRRYAYWIENICGPRYNREKLITYFTNTIDVDATTLSSISKVLCADDVDIDELRELRKNLIEHNPVASKNPISVNEIKTILREKENEYNHHPSMFLGYQLQFLYFITIFGVFRAADYINTSVDKSGDNYIDLDMGVMFITKSKNLNSIRSLKIPNVLLSIIKQNAELNGSKWLFPIKRDPSKHMSMSNFNIFVGNAINRKGIGTERLRKIFRAHYYESILDEDERNKQFHLTGDMLGMVNTNHCQKEETKEEPTVIVDKEEKTQAPLNETMPPTNIYNISIYYYT